MFAINLAATPHTVQLLRNHFPWFSQRSQLLKTKRLEIDWAPFASVGARQRCGQEVFLGNGRTASKKSQCWGTNWVVFSERHLQTPACSPVDARGLPPGPPRPPECAIRTLVRSQPDDGTTGGCGAQARRYPLRRRSTCHSRLMGGDEEATLVTLSAHRKITDRLIEQHHGRFVNSAGDSGPNQLGIPCQSDAGSLRLPSLLQCYYQSPYACPVRIGLCRGFLALARTRLPCVVASTRRLLVALLRRLLGTDCLGEVKPRQTDGTPRADESLY